MMAFAEANLPETIAAFPLMSAGEHSKLINDTQGSGLESATMTVSGKQTETENTELENRLFTSKAYCKFQASKFVSQLGMEWRRKFFAQLDSLMDPDDWDEDDPVVELESFDTFLRMMVLLKPDRLPGLAVSNNGHIVAAWFVGKDRLTVECFPYDKLRWVLTVSSDGGKESVAGTNTPLLRLIDSLNPYGPARWFKKDVKN